LLICHPYEYILVAMEGALSAGEVARDAVLITEAGEFIGPSLAPLVMTGAHAARPEPGFAAYAAGRAGQNALVRAVGREYARSGVVVNAVDTDFPDWRHVVGQLFSFSGGWSA
jgi:NAD(P)-dependent dehydrogenase (short-subunit alcohol dehydrogenase family)